MNRDNEAKSISNSNGHKKVVLPTTTARTTHGKRRERKNNNNAASPPRGILMRFSLPLARFSDINVSFTSSRQGAKSSSFSPNCRAASDSWIVVQRAVEGSRNCRSRDCPRPSIAPARKLRPHVPAIHERHATGKAKLKAATKLKAAPATKGGGGGERFLTTERRRTSAC